MTKKPKDPAGAVFANLMAAEEAIASTEIEFGPMDPRTKFITKVRLTFDIGADITDDEIGQVYDERQKYKEQHHGISPRTTH